jgi:hypothetical protein
MVTASNRSWNEPRPRRRNISIWAIARRGESTSVVANQSCQISAIRSSNGCVVRAIRSTHQSTS